jgi:hypothetical protein
MALKNTQTTRQYDRTRETTENKTQVDAKEYDATKETTKQKTQVTATVEGSQ